MAGPKDTAPECCNYDGGRCFPGRETLISLRDGSTKFIEDVEVGDHVKIMEKNGEFGYSPVCAQGHKNKDRKAEFIQLSTESSRILISPRHFIKVFNDGDILDIFAENVKIGDMLLVDCFNKLKPERVLERDIVESQGLYAPFTEEGNIVINGVVASCYAEVKPHLAHKLLSPIRALNRFIPTTIMDFVMTPNKDGVPIIFDATLNAVHSLVVE